MKKLIAGFLGLFFSVGVFSQTFTVNNLVVQGTSTIPYTTAGSGSASTVEKKLAQIVNIQDFGATCNGVAIDNSAISAFITQWGSTPVTLQINCPLKINTGVTFNSNTELAFDEGGSITGTSGVEVINIQAPIKATRHLIFSNDAPTATTSPQSVYPEWFGAVRNGSTSDSAAINSALTYLKNVGGTVSLAAGNYALTAPLVMYTHETLAGAGMNITLLTVTGPSTDAIHAFGVAGTPLANIVIKDLSPVSSPSSSGSIGISLQYTAFARLENIQVQEFLTGLNFQGATNSQVVQVGATYVAGASNGFIGFNFNGTGGTTSGNASTTLRNCFAGGNNTLTGSIGYKLTGTYMSDLFFDTSETAGTNYGYYFDFSLVTGAAAQDIQILRPIVDQFTAQGILIQNQPTGGRVSINGGWINPKAGANNGTTDIYMSGNSGTVAINGVQITADTDIANTTGVAILNSSGVTLTGNLITNTNIGVNMSGGAYNNIVGNSFKNDASAAAYYIRGVGDARTMVNGNSFMGFATVGVSFDATSSGSGVVGNTFRITNIGTRVSNSSTGPVGSSDGSTGLNSGY